MTTVYSTAQPGESRSWLRRVEGWLDDRGKAAWIAAMVLGFIFIWPVGLAFLAYMIWSKRMFTRTSCSHRAHQMKSWSHSDKWGHCHGPASSGNSAFDAYRTETLRRLEDEQAAFEAFLQRLRDAKDKSEFDNFMDDRARSNAAAADTPATAAPESPRTGEY